MLRAVVCNSIHGEQMLQCCDEPSVCISGLFYITLEFKN